MAWFNTGERTFLCLKAIAVGVPIGRVTIGCFFRSEVVGSQSGALLSVVTAGSSR